MSAELLLHYFHANAQCSEMQVLTIGSELLIVPSGKMLEANALVAALASLQKLTAVEFGFLLTETETDWPSFFQPLPHLKQIRHGILRFDSIWEGRREAP